MDRSPLPEDRTDYLMALRGVAASGVFLSHTLGIGPLSLGAVLSHGQYSFALHQDFYGASTVIEWLTPLYGSNFVGLFFVLSGYLMGKVLLSGRYDGPGGVKRFYKARFFRLAPALYVNLLVCWALFSQADLSPTKTLGDLLFINNVTGRGLNLVTWSLSYEAQFYFVCPLLALLAIRYSRYAFFLLTALVLAVCMSVKSEVLAFSYVFLAGFAINLASLPSKVRIFLCRLRWPLAIIVFGALHVGFNVLYFYQFSKVATLVATMASVILIYICISATAEARARPSILIGPMIFLGHITYGLYLWHYVVIRTRAGGFERIARMIGDHLDLPLWSQIAIYHTGEIVVLGAISVALGYLSYIGIERRFRPSLYSASHRRIRSE